MKYVIAAAAVCLAAPVASAKVLIDVDGGAGYSFNSLNEGTLADGSIDLRGTQSSSEPVGLNQEAENGLYVWTKISVPIFPDVGLKYENLVSSGTNTIDQEISYGGETHTYSEVVDSELDLSYLDITLSYGIPLPMASVDFGLNFRSMIGGFNAEGRSSGEKVEAPFELEGTPLIIPMGYLAGSFSPPVPGVDLTFSGELKTLPLGQTSLNDFNIKGTWYAPLPTNLLVKLGVEAGYRNYSLAIGDSTLGADTSQFASDVSFSGFFLGAAAHF